MEKKKIPLMSLPVDPTWTLFLDRDGVININKADSYVFNRAEFIFCEGALEAIFRLSRIFGKIIVITNQRGVGKELMTEDDLDDIHVFMKKKIECCGGRVDAIFFCTSIDDTHPDRKPNPGMAYKAKERFPEIDFAKSIMVGDKLSDMQWAKAIGAYSMLVPADFHTSAKVYPEVDFVCESLYDFALSYMLVKT